MNSYKALNKQIFNDGNYALVPLRFEDRFDIRQWRNEQIYHLRQNKPLTIQDQDNYFNNVVNKLFDAENPNQILFSFLEKDICVGYGGLVHINWVDKNAEISFIINTKFEKDNYKNFLTIFLRLIEKVAFSDLQFHKIFTYAFDIRPQLYPILESSGFFKDAVLKEHCLFNGAFKDVVIHSKLMHNKPESMNNLMYTFTNFFDLTIEEKVMVLGWKNDENIRKWMYNTDAVKLENHISFIEKLKNDSTKFYFLVKRKEVPVGVISIVDVVDKIGDWGYYIAPYLHDKNLGVEFYYFSLLHIYRKLKLSKVIGYVLKENKAANSFSDLFGFTKSLHLKQIGGENEEYYYREMSVTFWEEKIVNNPKIIRLLQLTINN